MKEKLGVFAKNLRQGQTIYRVYGLGEWSYLQKLMVMSRPYLSNLGHWLIDVRYEDMTIGFESLWDMNALCGLNSYNRHRVFTSNRRAFRYLNGCLIHNIGSIYEVEYDYELLYW